MASEEPMGRAPVVRTLLLPQCSRNRGSGAQWALFGEGAEGDNNLLWVRKHWGKEEPVCKLHGPLLTPGPLASLQEYLPWPGLAPGVPLTPGGLHTISSWLPPSSSSGPEMKKKCHYQGEGKEYKTFQEKMIEDRN